MEDIYNNVHEDWSYMKLHDLTEMKEASIDLDGATDIDLANFVLNAAAVIAIRDLKDENLEGDALVDEVDMAMYKIIKEMNERVDSILHGGGDRLKKIIKANLK